MSEGGFSKKTVKDFNFDNKRVLMRADYNVPVKDGKISDDYRIKQSLETIKWIIGHPGSRLVIISHLGRPKGPDDKDASLKPVAEHLSKLLDRKVHFVSDCIGPEAKAAAEALDVHGILLMENLRFHPEEEKNDKAFAQAIVDASDAEVFVQDGFGVVHRAHASTDAITHLLPSVAGLLLEKEVITIQRVIKDPVKPVVSVIGGAKVSDKIEIINKLIDISDCVAIVGAMANNFLLAEGFRVGKSMVEREVLETTKEILARARHEERRRNFNFLIPTDVVVSANADGTAPTRVVDIAGNNLADIEAYPKVPGVPSHTIGTEEMILDIGPISAGVISGAIRLAETVIWNGTCGVTETRGIAGAEAPFAHGTRAIVDAMISTTNHHKNKPFTFVGGGDTVSYVEQQGLTEDFGHVSTGGGASLELIAGHKLPGVEALPDK
jgi:3-phosphoglycerate kinase